MENRRLLGLGLALGIVAGAVGAFVMTRAGTSAEGVPAAVEGPPAVEVQATDVPLEPVAIETPKPPVSQSPVERRPAVTTPSPRQASCIRRHSSAPRRERFRPGGDSGMAGRARSCGICARASDRPEPDVIAAVERPKFEDLVLPAQSVIGIGLDSTLSSGDAQVEDAVKWPRDA